jgi:hypothetical protein
MFRHDAIWRQYSQSLKPFILKLITSMNLSLLVHCTSHCATSRQVAGSIPDGVIGIFHWNNPSGRTVALGSTWPLTEMNRLRLKCDGTRAETRCGLSAKRTSPFKSAGASVQSTPGSRGVRISGSNAGYTMFWGSVKVYWLPTPFASLPFTSPPVRHRVPSHFNWTVPGIFPRE